MNVKVHFQNLDQSPWMTHFIENRVHRLDKYLDPSARVSVNLRYVNRKYVTSVAIHHSQHDYAFMTQAENLFESMSSALEKALRSLGEKKRMVKDRINKRYTSIRKIELAL